MRGEASTTTRSEALQRITDQKDCPSLLECESEVTKDYFRRICGAKGYVRCHHFARKMGELMPPMAWLQRQAMSESNREAEKRQTQSPSAVK